MAPNMNLHNHSLLVRAAVSFALSLALMGADSESGSAAAQPRAKGRFDVRDYGAAGDGRTLDSLALNQAIQACAAAGGGQVLFPPGAYLSGSLHLRNGVTLLLEAGATLVGSTNLADYERFAPPADTPEGRFRPAWHRALILGDGLQDTAVIGPGIINGNKVFDPQGEERMRGPHTILLGNGRHLTLRDITIIDSANYAVLLENCQQVEVRNVKITGGWDGVHFRGWPGRACRDVTIVGCQFYTGDDSIAGRYWENVLISDCIVNSSCNGIRLIGPATHLVIHGCLFYGPGVHPHRTSNRYNMLAAINLQPGAWDKTEGVLDDVLIADVTMRNVTTPFHFTLKPGNTAGRLTINRVGATGVYRAASSVESWADAPFTNVVFRDVSIEFDGGGTLADARLPIKPPPADARPLPAWGFYARNVKHLAFENVRLSLANGDLRPVLIGERVERLTLDGFKFPRLPGAADPLLLTNVAEVHVRDTDLPAPKP